MNFRIVKVHFHNGDVRYSVERSEDGDVEWTRFYTAQTLEEARKVKEERIAKQIVSREIIE